MPDEGTLFIHVITVPLTLALGFLIGWILRGAVARRIPRRPGSVPPA